MGWCWDGEFPAPCLRPLAQACWSGFGGLWLRTRKKGGEFGCLRAALRRPSVCLLSSRGVLCAVLRRPGPYLKQFRLSNTPRKQFLTILWPREAASVDFLSILEAVRPSKIKLPYTREPHFHFFHLFRPGCDSECSWTAPGKVLGAFSAHIRSSWAVFGEVLGGLGASWGGLGVVLGWS